MKIYLPDWYPAPRHLKPISFFDFAEFLEFALIQSNQCSALSKLLPTTEHISFYKFSLSLKKIRLYKSIDILDILIWTEQYNNKISGEELSKVLWPCDLVNLKKRYFETARPLAFSLLHPSAIRFLRSISNNHSVYI